MTRQITSAILLLVLVLSSACGASAREKALRANLVALNTARDGFVAWDETHQNQIVDESTSFEAGEAALDAYRLNREQVVRGFEVAYRALAVAAFEPTAGNALAVYNEILTVWNLIQQITGARPADPVVKE